MLPQGVRVGQCDPLPIGEEVVPNFSAKIGKIRGPESVPVVQFKARSRWFVRSDSGRTSIGISADHFTTITSDQPIPDHFVDRGFERLDGAVAHGESRSAGME